MPDKLSVLFLGDIIGLTIGVVIYVVMHMYFFKDMKIDIENLQQKIFDLEREIEKGLQAKADLPKLEEDIQSYKLELDRLTRILPTRKETPALIKRLKQLNELGFFRLVRFTPGAFVDQQYYWEWPIAVELEGTYHELGQFFDRLSRFSRIINVRDLQIKPYRQTKGDPAFTIKATFTQRTFVYKGEPEPAGGAQ